MCITLITSAKPLWPRRVAYSQVLGSRRRTSLGGHYSMYHMLCGSCSWLPFLNSDAAACSGSGGTWQVCSTPTGIWDLGSSLWTKFSIWTVPLLEAMGGHKGTLLRARSEARHWAWPIPQLLSLMPTVPGCSRVSSVHALLAVMQFFLLAPVLLTGSHWPGTSSSSLAFPSLRLAWSTPRSHSPGWIPGCLPLGAFVLQMVVSRALLTVTRSSGLPN